MRKFSVLLICLAAFGCATRPDTAPIENITQIPSYLQPNSSSSTTKPSSQSAPTVTNSQAQPSSSTTMGSLSDNGNSVSPVPAPSENNTAHAAPSATVNPNLNATSGWIMPTQGKADGYKSSTKGVDIYGEDGQMIYAANDGKVVYSGNGLKGYGNLIIIKHDSTYLTAYAQNKVNLVKEGASVKRGQKIAKMGTDDNGRAVLHFELRKNGKPIDPFSVIKNN